MYYSYSDHNSFINIKASFNISNLIFYKDPL